MARLRIVDPCAASWDAMAGTERVRHCDACNQDVHDLTHLGERESRGYQHLRAGASMCARILAVGAAVAACGSPPHPAPAARPVDHAPDVMEAGIADAPAIDSGADAGKNVVVVTMGELPILTFVHFAKSKTAIAPEAFPIVDDVVAVLKASPQITRVEVGGHASLDEHGAQSLSEKRASAVIAKMVAEGIDPKRLVAKGYAATLPIDDNKTDDGRGRNRRVEFKILENEDSSACALDAGAH